MGVGLEPYASVEAFKTAVELSTAASVAEVDAALVQASRIIDRRLGRPAGAFNRTSTAEVRYFTGSGKSRLRLRNVDGMHTLLSVSTDGIAVDTENDGTYDGAVFDPATETWAQLVGSAPHEALELRSWTANTVLTSWPQYAAGVRITGIWGYESVPEEIAALTVKIARDLRDSLRLGARGDAQVLDSGVVIRDETWRVWRDIEAAYDRSLPGFA